MRAVAGRRRVAGLALAVGLRATGAAGSAMEPFLAGLRATFIVTKFATTFFMMGKAAIVSLTRLRAVMGKALFATVTELALLFAPHARTTVLVVGELFATRSPTPLMVVVFAAFATTFVAAFAFATAIPMMAAMSMTRGTLVAEFAESMMVVVFATTAAMAAFAFATAIPMMAAMPVTRGTLVAEFAESMVVVVFALTTAFAAAFTFATAIPMLAAMSMTRGTFVTELAESMVMVVSATAFAAAFAFATAIPVVAATPVTRGTFVTELAETMVMVVFATAFAAFTFATAIPVLAAMSMTGGAFVAEFAEPVVMMFARASLLTVRSTLGETFAAEPFSEAVMMFSATLSESLSAIFAKSVMMLTRRAALRTAVLHSRILRTRSRRLLATRAATLRAVLRKLLRTLPGLRALLRPGSTLSKSLSGFHAERMMEMLLSISLRAAALGSLRALWARSVLISGTTLRTLHPLGCAGRQQFVPGNLAIAIAIELFQNLGRVLHFLGIDDAVVIGIEGVEKGPGKHESGRTSGMVLTGIGRRWRAGLPWGRGRRRWSGVVLGTKRPGRKSQGNGREEDGFPIIHRRWVGMRGGAASCGFHELKRRVGEMLCRKSATR